MLYYFTFSQLYDTDIYIYIYIYILYIYIYIITNCETNCYNFQKKVSKIIIFKII